jgi:hypothetical protein
MNRRTAYFLPRIRESVSMSDRPVGPIARTRHPKANPGELVAVWLLAIMLGVTFWTMVIHFAPVIVGPNHATLVATPTRPGAQ